MTKPDRDAAVELAVAVLRKAFPDAQLIAVVIDRPGAEGQTVGLFSPTGRAKQLGAQALHAAALELDERH